MICLQILGIPACGFANQSVPIRKASTGNTHATPYFEMHCGENGRQLGNDYVAEALGFEGNPGACSCTITCPRTPGS